MKRLNLNICAMFALALAVSSCAEEELMKDSFVPSPSNTITFGASDIQVEVLSRSEKGENSTLSITESKLVSEDGELSLPMMVKVEEGIHRVCQEAPASRADKVEDMSAIGHLHAWATHTVGDTPALYFNDETGEGFTKNAGIFFADAAEPYLWPEADGTLDFVTVVNMPTENFTPNFNANNQIVSFNYTVPTDAANQPDILVAKASGVSDGLGESVPLDFKHIMAAVNFKLGELSNNIEGTIKSIKLIGVSNEGTYLVDNHTWTNRSTVDGGEFIVPLNDAGTANGVTLMMIPQLLDTGAEVEIVFVDDRVGEKPLRANIQGDVWEPNTTTHYLINIDGNYNLQITPRDKVLDSHYIITRVDVKSDFPYWELTAIANDNADVTLEFEELLNPMAKIGFWTDKKSFSKNGDDYILSSETARGVPSISGTQVSNQTIAVFIPENISGETRKITLTLKGGADAKNLNAEKVIVMEQNSVKWLQNPYGDDPNLYWGCELLLEGGQIEWGFCFEGDNLKEQWRVSGRGNENTQPKGWITKITNAMKAAGLNVDELHDANNPIHIIPENSFKSTFLISIDYAKLGVLIDVADDTKDGEQNTLDLYGFEGINVVASIKDFIEVVSDEIEHTEGSFTGEFETTIDFAAMYAMKRNRFNLYETNVEGTMMYVPIIENEDINWYLPAKDQFPYFMDKNWGQQGFSFTDNFWTSTAYTTESDNTKAYAYINGEGTIAHRNDKYLTFALRKWSEEVGTPADKDLVGYVPPANEGEGEVN